MITLIKLLMKQKIFTNLFVILVFITGYFVVNNMNRERYPEVNFDMVSIKTIYPGGSPDEIEKLITIPIEKKLREVDGLDKVRAYNIENVSVVVVYLDDKVTDRKEVIQNIKDAVELVDNIPAKAEKPLVEEIKLDKTPAIDVAIYAKKQDVSYKKLRDVANELEDFFYDIDGIAEVELFGYYDREFLVEVNPKSLKKYRIGMNTVINKLKKRNVDYPGGPLKIGDKEFILRTKGQYENIEEIKKTVILANDMGFVTRIKDIAKVKDTFEDADVYDYYNGKKAIILKLWKKRSADEIKLVERIRKEVKNHRLSKLRDITLEFLNDTSIHTKINISSFLTNAATGFVLLAAILLLLLGFRIAALVTAGIPLAFMIAFIGLNSLGLTINIITLFGMVMVLGMIVDFSIVVSENAHRYMEMGLNKLEAIQKGVIEVIWPVTVTLLCICAAFLPLLFLTGILGKFVRGIPIVIMICLVASWYISMFIMPTFLNIISKSAIKPHDEDLMKNGHEHFEKGLFGKLQRFYKKILQKALKFRYVTIGILIAMLAGSLVLIKVVGFIFMPGGGADKLQIKTYMPQETNLEANLREIKKINKVISKLKKDELVSVHIRIGVDEPTGVIDPKPGEGTHKSTIFVYLTPDKNRKRDAEKILSQLRNDINLIQKKGIISQKMRIEFMVKQPGPPVGKPVNLEVRGDDFATLKKISKDYIDFLKQIDGVTDISMDLEEGKLEYRYVINEVIAAITDVSVLDVAQGLNASFEGAVATSIMKKEEEVNIRVRFPEYARKDKDSLKNVMIKNKAGGLISLASVTNVKKQTGYSQINRLDFKRLVQVQAEVDKKIITPIQVNRRLAKMNREIEKKYPGYSISFGGAEERRRKSMGELGVKFLFAIVVIYIIIAVFFNSLILPIVIMSAIPFSLVGVVLALFFHGETFSFMSVLGLFSLAGVIVSNTLVLVQFINYKRDEGMSLKDSLIEGGVIRLRPVILTTGTTVLGLFPTIYGIGHKDHFVAPLALAFGYGLIFATFITLILIPCFYHVAEDFKGIFSKILSYLGINISGTIYQPQGKK